MLQPYFEEPEGKIYQGDCLEVLKTLQENSVDSIVTDPPYELGFMGKSWDNTGIANDKNMWSECLRVLKPGGHLLSFAATRTYHRMAVAIEDAGFEVRDMIEWVYGSGFPKSLSVDKDIDEQYFEREARKYPEYVSKSDEFQKTKEGRSSRSKWQKQFKIEKGLCRQKIGDNKNHRTLKETNCMVGEPHSGDGSLTEQFTPEAKQWEGWGTATKPAHEPIAFCSKPLTIELVFAKMGIDITNNLLNLCQKYNVNVKDAESNLNSILLKLEKVGVNTVAENARMCDWENIENAVIVALNFMSQKHILKEKTEESREASAQTNVKESGNNDSQEKTIQTGKADNLREQMATLQNMLATETIGLNTILLWKEVLEGVLEKAKMSTISTALEMTTGLKICNSLLKANTQNYTRTNEIHPNHEPICMARKPLSEKTVAENVLKYGTGGINIDESRVESKPRLTGTLNKGEEIKAEPTSFKGSGTRKLQTGYDEKMAESNLGRFPANLIHDNSEEVRECFPESKSGSKPGQKGKSILGSENGETRQEIEHAYGDSGNASRFFRAIPNDERKNFKSIIYQAKASKSERNMGCEGLENKPSQLNSGGIGRECSVKKRLEENGENAPIMKNNHPTVKPIALMEYLIKMITPKGGIVLDPFAGSGSTLIAAKKNGFQYIGIEKEKDYCEISKSRLLAIQPSLL